MKSRQYQTDLKNDIYSAWDDGARNVLGVLPTGGGKTWMFTDVVKENLGPSVTIAHRQEIVSQISMSFSKHKVRHSIIAPKEVIQLINRVQMEKLGYTYYHPNAQIAVAGVRTLIRRKGLERWKESVTLWVQDEAHHILRSNEWGKAAAMFPNARGLGVTATPTRADGKGLGRHHDGAFDAMVEGPGMRELITSSFLSEYRIFAPPSDLDMSAVKVGANGDWTQPGTKAAVQKSQVIGDVVKHYKRIAPGKLGITFTPDVESATEAASKFNLAGVPAAVVSANTPGHERVAILRKFERRELLQLVNVDLFGEGFDLPAVEVVSMARPTQSFGLFCQQFGRALRPLDGKRCAIIIDHVGNVIRHGLPDRNRAWSLDRRERNVKKDADPEVIPVKACPFCLSVYEAIHRACPYCDHVPKPMARSGPEYVDGDLLELDAETLAAMRGEIVKVDQSPAEYLAESGAGRLAHVAAMGAVNRFKHKQEAQVALRESIAWWAGVQKWLGRSDSESYRRFYFRFGVDILSAQALRTKETNELKLAIDKAVNMDYSGGN